MSVVDPLRLADVTLAAAVRANADAVLLGPVESNEATYLVQFERARRIIANVTVDAQSGAAAIARLAYLADLDLVADHAMHAIVPVKSGDREADVAITIRPGTSLRAELAVMPRRRGAPVVVKPAPASKAGDVIGNYRVLERLGEGGMGIVYRVEHVLLGRTAALKQLRSRAFQREPSAADRFLREARAASRVRHPNIVEVFDFGYLVDGRPYFVMELLDGESLNTRVERGALSPPDAIGVVRQMANALAAVHDHGVVHADVTPGNAILVDRALDKLKLVDFGLSAIVGEDIASDDPDIVHGTPQYIAPEQLRGLPATDRSDQYSLGAVLFKLLTGKPPFEHDDLHELCLMHLDAPVPEIISPHGPLPAKLADIVLTCMQKSPGARFPGMRALVAALDDVERVADRRGWRKWLSS